ncbi:kinesin-like protein subito [Agrilus planipennis]|uniref:Kinesin-like protein n=1 Tax=Agrilus planipennis TaxID=224129 RepID=A0A1W4X099_AGRPL|nr:kinesin-like protein subito [Agrilus planipennis]
MDDLFEQAEMEAISYIKARDPSIQALNLPRRFDKPTNLLPLFGEESQQEDEKEEEDGRLQVYLRFKKADNIEQYYEVQNDQTLLCKIPSDAQCVRNIRNEKIVKKYIFTKIFPPDAKQVDIFNGVVKEKVLRFINGQNCSLFTYGASGSGKTFTILGTDQEPGIIPRALEYLFQTLPQLHEHTTMKPMHPGLMIRLNSSICKTEREACYQIINSVSDRKLHCEMYRSMQKRLSNEPGAVLDEADDVNLGVWVTFAEIYNESIYDLLVPQPPRGKSRQKLCLGAIRGNNYIKNLKAVNVMSGLEAYMVLQYGQQNLQYAETQLNSHSSRSHCIFTIKLVQNSKKDNGTSMSQFHFCDLAGSERVKKTLNIGDRLKESNNINNSLLVLGKCISTVRDIQKNNSDGKIVPFRESKLTRLFQKALSGHEPIAMIVNLNPSRIMFDESLHVLNFSAIAKDIIVEKTIIRNERRESRFSQFLQSKSTGISEFQKYYDEEKEALKSIICQLQTELQLNEDTYQRDRARIVAGYKDIIDNIERCHQQQMANLKQIEDNKVKLLEGKINMLKSQLDNDCKSGIIDLTMDENDIDYYIEELERCQRDIERQKIHYEGELRKKDVEITYLNKKLSIAEEDNQKLHLQEKIKQLEEEVATLKDTLSDAQNDYVELEAKLSEYQDLYEAQVLKIVQLEEENSQLKAALHNSVRDSEDDFELDL